MNFAYMIENTGSEEMRDNSKLFSLLRDPDIHEDNIYIDTEDSREEIHNLINTIKRNDRLIIRSVLDLAEEAKELLEVLEELQSKSVILCSIQEAYLNGTDYYTAMRGFVDINRYYMEVRRKTGYAKAKENGKVGRPQKTEAVEKAVRLYKTKAFSIEEIEKLSGVSSSTLYRALKDIDKQE